MSKLNIIGTIFTITILCTILGLSFWRLWIIQKQLLDCYTEQVKNMVHIDTGD